MNEFSYSYFSGANVSITVNNTYLDCAGISYKLLSSKQPIYSHYSPRYDMLSTSRQIIQGSFVINYTKADYLFYILVDDPTLYDQVKSITTQYTTSERTRHPGYYLQYNNVKAFDIEIDFGKNNFTILKNCYITSRAQTINIDDNVLLEEYSFVAREIKIRQGESVKENESQNKASSTVQLAPPETKAKIDPPKPVAVVTESKPVDPPKPVANTAVIKTINKKIDDKTTEAVKVEQVRTPSGAQIPVEKVIDKKTSKIEFDGSPNEKIKLIAQNVAAMNKIIEDAEKKHPGDDFKKNEYIFNQFKNMAGGIPPSSRYLPTDMNNQAQLQQYYADGALFVKKLSDFSKIKNIEWNGNLDVDKNPLEDFFDIANKQAAGSLTQGEYYAAQNTLLLTSKVMLPLSNDLLHSVTRILVDGDPQDKIVNLIDFNTNRENNFVKSYEDVKDKDKIILDYAVFNNGDYSENTFFKFHHIYQLQGDSNSTIEETIKSDNLSYDKYLKTLKSTKDLKKFDREKFNPEFRELVNEHENMMFRFNNYYDSFSTANGKKMFLDKNKMSIPDYPFQIKNEEYQDLNSFNGFTHYEYLNKKDGFYVFSNYINSDYVKKSKIKIKITP